MPVSDFECQITRGQIGRYLGGDTLSPAAMMGLEEHLGECPECKALIAERRAALMGMLGGETPARAVVAMPIENPLVAALRAKVGEEEPTVEAPKEKAAPRYAKAGAAKPSFGKPLALAALLAGVLVAMSYVSRATHGGGALGTKAATGFAADAIPDSPPKAVVAKPVPEPAPKPTPATKPKPVPTKVGGPDAAVKPPAPKAAVAVAKAKALVPARPKARAFPAKAPRRVARKLAHAPRRVVRRRKPLRPIARTSVRVYGLDGHPLKP